MATQTALEISETPVLLRMAAPERDRLWNIIFQRYPQCEWGTFIRLGFRETSLGLLLTVQGIDDPKENDLKEDSCIVEINPQYIRRILRSTETNLFAIGFVHSHPEDYRTDPSLLDDDMELYLSDLLKGYTPERPFVSLIFSRSNGNLSGSGRVYWKGKLFTVTRFAIEGEPVSLYNHDKPLLLSEEALERVKRLASLFSIESANALAGSTVGIVGLSGTGSPVAELLARSGVGNIVLVDPDVFSDSNLERVHGSSLDHLGTEIPKVLLAKKHILSINPVCNVIAIQGRIPQKEVVDQLMWCDIVLGCTDSQSSRVALTEISLRFLVPVIDVGVSIEGANCKITGQVLQVNRLFSHDPCVYCRNLINPQIVSQELMSNEEKEHLQLEAQKAKEENRPENAYWLDIPQLNTVGYLTTMAGSIVSGFTIGYLTGRFNMPSNRLELNFSPKATQIIEPIAKIKKDCNCQSFRGSADQNPIAVFITPPLDWQNPIIY
jgi:molybdopterin/thiamine biosynthesis adenylyltransferase